MNDPINPDHYKQGDIECIDAIRAALGPDGFKAYCKGQVIKYLWRAEHKGSPTQDYCKAEWYCDHLAVDAVFNEPLNAL
jgi:hypothetical protein